MSWMADTGATHPVSTHCSGERCVCGEAAAHKVGEEQLEPDQTGHNLTAYVCCRCFVRIFGRCTP